MTFHIPADLRARAEKYGIKIGTVIVVNFAYPDGEEVTTVQAPWDRWPEKIFCTSQIEELISVAASPIEE